MLNISFVIQNGPSIKKEYCVDQHTIIWHFGARCAVPASIEASQEEVASCGARLAKACERSLTCNNISVCIRTP